RPAQGRIAGAPAQGARRAARTGDGERGRSARVGPPQHDVGRAGETEGAALGDVDVPDGRAVRDDAGAAHGEKTPGPRKERVPPAPSTITESPARRVSLALSGSERPGG